MKITFTAHAMQRFAERGFGHHDIEARYLENRCVLFGSEKDGSFLHCFFSLEHGEYYILVSTVRRNVREVITLMPAIWRHKTLSESVLKEAYEMEMGPTLPEEPTPPVSEPNPAPLVAKVPPPDVPNLHFRASSRLLGLKHKKVGSLSKDADIEAQNHMVRHWLKQKNYDVIRDEIDFVRFLGASGPHEAFYLS